MKVSIESLTGDFIATGIVAVAREFLSAEERAALVKGEVAPQMRDDHGRPLVDVEVLMEEEAFGRASTSSVSVRVPQDGVEGLVADRSSGALSIEGLAKYGPVRFSGLTVNVYARKAGGLGSSWSAEALRVA